MNFDTWYTVLRTVIVLWSAGAFLAVAFVHAATRKPTPILQRSRLTGRSEAEGDQSHRRSA